MTAREMSVRNPVKLTADAKEQQHGASGGRGNRRRSTIHTVFTLRLDLNQDLFCAHDLDNFSDV